MTLRYAVEPFMRWYVDAKPLFQAHWAEVARHRERFELAPDWGRFIATERQGRLFSVTARDCGALAGYAVFVLGPHLHYRQMVAAVCDMIYIDPAHRVSGLAYRGLVAYCDDRLREQGAHMSLQRAKLSHGALGIVLERVGYTPIEQIYERML